MNLNKQSQYLLFIDESGKSKLSDDGSNRFLLSGLIIDQDLHIALSNYMISLKLKSKISPFENIHAYDLFENEKVKDQRLAYGEINKFFKRLTHLIEGSHIKSIVIEIDKSSYKRKVEQDAIHKGVTTRALLNHLKRQRLHDFLYEALARKLILEFGHFLEKESACGRIVAESRRNEDESVLRAYLDSTDTSKYDTRTHYSLWSNSCFERISSLTFENKKGQSFGLEIADLFAWASLSDPKPIRSQAKAARVSNRLCEVKRLLEMTTLKNKNPEIISGQKLTKIAGDRVSKFNDCLKNYRSNL